MAEENKGANVDSSKTHAAANEAVPSEGTASFSIPPRPPVITRMPKAPETIVELTVPPPPMYQQKGEVTKEELPPLERAPIIPTDFVPTIDSNEPQKELVVTKPFRTTVQQDTPAQLKALEDDVGLTIPAPAKRAPVSSDIAKIIAATKLPERRVQQPTAQTPHVAPPATTHSEAPNLEDILAARVTEKSQETPGEEQVLTPSSAIQKELGQEPIVPTQEVFHEPMSIEPVHTLKHDLQSVVREQKMSVVRAAALEQEKRRPEPIVAQPVKRSHAAAYTIASAIALIILGAGSLATVVYVSNVQTETPQSPLPEGLVFAEQSVSFPLTSESPDTQKSKLAAGRDVVGTLGSITHIVPLVESVGAEGVTVQTPATLEQFFSAIGLNPPDNLLRALGQEYFFGFHTVDENAPVLVVRVSSYDRAFDGMLDWEPRMNEELSPIFQQVPRYVTGKDGVVVARTFTDTIMRNYDVRTLKDDTGTIQLYYSFPTRSTLIIAESPYTFTEVLGRLQASSQL